jgi:transcriptional regulator with XRE-family HTH domain
MEKNRVGNLLAGARLKAGLTQEQLADKLEIRQNMVSDYERGRRVLSPEMARRFSSVLQVQEARLKYGPPSQAPRRRTGKHAARS